MSNRLKAGLARLAERRTEFMSETVTYRRGADEVELQATIGRTFRPVRVEFGVEERAETVDFLIAAADLILAAVEVLPEDGDQIVVTSGATEFTHEVMRLGGEASWRYADEFKKTLRIHTKLTATT